MSETGESGKPLVYSCEVFNAPEEMFLEEARGIPFTREDFVRYSELEKRDSPGLAAGIGSWVYLLRREWGDKMPPHMVEVAESSMNAGALMTYELVRRIAKRIQLEVPNPLVNPDDLVDNRDDLYVETPDSWLIDLSRRGHFLPTRFPAIFKANIIMLEGLSGLDESEIRQMLFTKAHPDMLSFKIANFLAGAAEIVIPIERYAHVDTMNRDFH